MTKKKLPDYDAKAFDLVVIEWVDACGSATSQFASPEEAVASFQPPVRKSVGYWAGATDEHVVFGTDDDRAWGGSTAIGGVHCIPRGMVRSVSVLGQIKKRRATK